MTVKIVEARAENLAHANYYQTTAIMHTYILSSLVDRGRELNTLYACMCVPYTLAEKKYCCSLAARRRTGKVVVALCGRSRKQGGIVRSKT